MAADILAEQKKIKDADLIIFQFPLHWMSFPSIMKGWFDRVFTENFAFVYSLDPPFYVYDGGLLKVSYTCRNISINS